MRETETELLPVQEALERFKETVQETHPVSFEIMDMGGIHPDKGDEPFLDPYTNEESTEDFSNIGEHCVAVGYCADRIATALENAGVFSPDDRHTVVGHALVHDVMRRLVVHERNAKKSFRDWAIHVEDDVALEHVFLRFAEEELPSEEMIGYLRVAGKETGHLSLKDFVTIDTTGSPALREDITMAKLVVHIADDMTASPKPGTADETKFVTVEERIQLGNFPERHPHLYRSGFGFTPEGEARVIDDVDNEEDTRGMSNVRTYAEWQVLVFHMAVEKIQKALDQSSTESPEIFVKRLVTKDLLV